MNEGDSRETSVQRFDRYVGDLRQRLDEVMRKQLTGQLVLTINLNAGHPRNRSIELTETKA